MKKQGMNQAVFIGKVFNNELARQLRFIQLHKMWRLYGVAKQTRPQQRVEHRGLIGIAGLAEHRFLAADFIQKHAENFALKGKKGPGRKAFPGASHIVSRKRRLQTDQGFARLGLEQTETVVCRAGLGFGPPQKNALGKGHIAHGHFAGGQHRHHPGGVCRIKKAIQRKNYNPL